MTKQNRVHCTIIETALALRGTHRLMNDLKQDPGLVHSILDITCNYHKAVSLNMAKQGVDMIWLGDDLGSPTGLLYPPEVFREFLKPRLVDLIKGIKMINMVISYHFSEVLMCN